MNHVIAFNFAFDGKPTEAQIELALVFCENIRIYQSKAHLVQMTDENTDALNLVDECVRTKRRDLAQWYWDAMTYFPYDEYLHVETDCILRGDVLEVLEHDFDIAIAKERKGMMNNGVLFVKNRQFFAECEQMYYQRTSQDGWNDLQVATQMAIDEGHFRIRKLDPEVYNVIMDGPRSYHTNQRILHFKGDAKRWMLEDFWHRKTA